MWAFTALSVHDESNQPGTSDFQEEWVLFEENLVSDRGLVKSALWMDGDGGCSAVVVISWPLPPQRDPMVHVMVYMSPHRGSTRKMEFPSSRARVQPQ